jgi:orotidine-5'-phosphate decarboxylase
MIPRPPDPLIVALDLSDLERAEALATALAPHAGMLKVGLELFTAFGRDAVTRIARHGPVFLDLKLHDIPHTVERAAENIAGMGVSMLSVHALGGDRMIAAAVRGATRGAQAFSPSAAVPRVVAVTALSSLSGEELASAASLAFEAMTAGASGVVASGDDVRAIREACGEELCVVVPGIRPSGSDGADQVRTLTPLAAQEKGADYIVVGRPIIESADPPAAARSILLELR